MPTVILCRLPVPARTITDMVFPASYVISSTKSSGSGTDATATLSNGGTAATATTTGSSGAKSSATGAAGKVELGFGAAVALAAAGLLNAV